MTEVQSKREGPIRNGNKPCLANELNEGKVDVEIIYKKLRPARSTKVLPREHRLLALPNYCEQSIADFRCDGASREIGNERHESSPFLSGCGHIAGPEVCSCAERSCARRFSLAMRTHAGRRQCNRLQTRRQDISDPSSTGVTE